MQKPQVKKTTIGGQNREKVAVCKLGRELSPETESAGTLTLDFQPPKWNSMPSQVFRGQALLLGIWPEEKRPLVEDLKAALVRSSLAVLGSWEEARCSWRLSACVRDS